jgi:flagellar biosynthesis component FlhA
MTQPLIASTVNTRPHTNYNSIGSSTSPDLESNTPPGCLANTAGIVRRNMCLIVGVPLTIALLGGAIALSYYLTPNQEDKAPPSEEEKRKQDQQNFFIMMCLLSSIYFGSSTDSSRESSSRRR